MVRYNRPEDVNKFDERLENATEKQKDAADDIDAHPTWPFNKHEEEGDHSASHYRDVYYQFFGPGDDKFERTFQEIKDKYGSISAYYDNRYELDGTQQQNFSEINARDLMAGQEIQVSDEMREILEIGLKVGFEQGYNIGKEHAKRDLER